MLQVENLSKKYKKSENYSLEDVSFSLNKGEIVGLIGKNGAGKTTLMKMLVKTLAPTKGTVLLENNNLFKGDNLLKDVGILIEPTYYGQLTVLENLNFYLDINKQSRYKGNIQSVLELVDLWTKKDKKPSSFSFGMKQRLSLAMCLITEPKLAIMDEPFVGLDPLGVGDLIKTLKLWAKEKNMAILISSHQLAELEELCERFIFIEKGKLSNSFSKDSNRNLNLIIHLEKEIDVTELRKNNRSVVKAGKEIVISYQSEELNNVLYYLTTHAKITSIELDSHDQLKKYFAGEQI